jgi:hypothetical protein
LAPGKNERKKERERGLGWDDAWDEIGTLRDETDGADYSKRLMTFIHEVAAAAEGPNREGGTDDCVSCRQIDMAMIMQPKCGNQSEEGSAAATR